MAAARVGGRVQRQVAQGVIERHQVGCRYARGRRRCTCRPAFRAQVKVRAGGVTTTATRTFPTLEEASAWRLRAREEALRSGAVTPPAAPAPVPAFGVAARDFLRQAAAGRALTRSRRPYAQPTVASYESALRRHVLPHVDERLGMSFDALPADAIEGRTLQAMVNAIAAEASPTLARVDAGREGHSRLWPGAGA